MRRLIEVNSSPACDYSTPVTKSYVTRALPDIFKTLPGLDDCDDNGDWNELYHGEEMQTQGNLLGLNIDLTLKGKKISTKKKRRAKQKGKENDCNGTDKKNEPASLINNCIEKNGIKETIPDSTCLIRRTPKHGHKMYEHDKENYCPTFKSSSKGYEGGRNSMDLKKAKMVVPLKTIVLDM